MSETQPLLSDAENSDPSEQMVPQTVSRWRGHTRDALESPTLHKLVITLIIIDAACVLSDLGYTFLADTCSSEPELPVWLEALAYVSLAITSLFLIEIPLACWAFGLHYFNPFGNFVHAPLHLFDAIIITTTFILEVILRGRERELAGLLIVLRLWRLVKLVGGITVGAGELGEEDAKQIAETRQRLSSALMELDSLHNENQDLRRRVQALELSASDV